MNTSKAAANPEFSLVLGGPLFQLLRRAHLSGDAMEMSNRRAVIGACITWLPLLLLTLASGHAFGDEVAVPFLHDIEAHVRFLIALPTLIVAELVVHRRLLPIVRQFVERRIVSPEEMPRFQQAIDSTLRLRNSVWIEIALILFVYCVGTWVWRNQVALTESSWYSTPNGENMRMTLAGYWLMFVSAPIFQFILLRWYFRFFLWFWFLFRVSRMNLKFLPTHPDRTGGLGFLGGSPMAFAPVLIAQGAVSAGLITSRIFYAGQALPDFKVQIVGFVGLFVVATLIPLTVFAPRLAEAKRAGLGDAGRLSSRYSRRFEDKWFHARDSADDENLLGSSDIQSLADLDSSMAVVQAMRPFPFGWRDATRLALITATPFLPLLLTIVSLDDLAMHIIKAVF